MKKNNNTQPQPQETKHCIPVQDVTIVGEKSSLSRTNKTVQGAGKNNQERLAPTSSENVVSRHLLDNRETESENHERLGLPRESDSRPGFNSPQKGAVNKQKEVSPESDLGDTPRPVDILTQKKQDLQKEIEELTIKNDNEEAELNQMGRDDVLDDEVDYGFNIRSRSKRIEELQEKLGLIQFAEDVDKKKVERLFEIISEMQDSEIAYDWDTLEALKQKIAEVFKQ